MRIFEKPISNQNLLKVIVVDIVIGLIVVGGLAFLTLRLYSSAIRQATHNNCVSINNLKAGIRSFIVIIPPPHETAAQKAYINGLIAEEKKDFSATKCST